MATEYDSVHAKCPFFMGGGKKVIICEGLDERSKLARLFDLQADRQHIRERYCDGMSFGDCPVFKCIVAARYGGR